MGENEGLIQQTIKRVVNNPTSSQENGEMPTEEVAEENEVALAAFSTGLEVGQATYEDRGITLSICATRKGAALCLPSY